MGMRGRLKALGVVLGMVMVVGATGAWAEEAATAAARSGPSLRSLLGQRQAAVERHHRATGTRDGGWVDYGSDLAVQYENGRAVRLRARVPAGMSCIDVARWAGYPSAGYPHRHRHSCEWPGISMRHRLSPRHAGALAGGVLELWIRD